MTYRVRQVVVAVILAAQVSCGRPGTPPAPTHVEVDELLVLMQQRLQVMHDVARWKWNEKKAIADPERERQLLERLAEEGKKRGLGPDFTRDFFRAQFDAARLLQQADFDEWKARGQGRFADTPDLAGQLRPRIDEVSNKLLDALPAVQAARGDTQFRQLLEERATLLLTGDGLTSEVRDRALAPLKD